jgi:hypothetical protein
MERIVDHPKFKKTAAYYELINEVANSGKMKNTYGKLASDPIAAFKKPTA